MIRANTITPEIGSGEVFVAIWPTHAHDPMDAAIKFLTRAQGTHASFVRGNGMIVENFFPRVRQRNWNPREQDAVEIYRIQDTTPSDWRELEQWFDTELANPPPYSILDLLRYAFDLPPVKGPGCFCSQWVLRGIRECLADFQQPLRRLEYQDFAPPSQLRSSPRLILMSGTPTTKPLAPAPKC